MTLKGRLAALGVVASMLLAMVAGGFSYRVFILLLLVTVVAVGIVWRWIPGFWKTVASGAAGGAMAGLVILAPGFRLAMRMVAIMDPFRRPEFSFGGAIFIMIMVGVLMGGLLGIVGILITRTANIRSPSAAGGLLGLVTVGVLMGNSGLRGELISLGAGLWLNLAMFGSVAIVYGIATMKVAARLGSEPGHSVTPPASTCEHGPTPPEKGRNEQVGDRAHHQPRPGEHCRAGTTDQAILRGSGLDSNISDSLTSVAGDVGIADRLAEILIPDAASTPRRDSRFPRPGSGKSALAADFIALEGNPATASSSANGSPVTCVGSSAS